MGRLEEFYNAHPHMAPREPHHDLEEGARRYIEQQRIPGALPLTREQFRHVEAQPHMGRQIARAYESMPDHDAAALPSFHSMARETGRQFEFLTSAHHRGGLGVHVEAVDEDPYETPQHMMDDLGRGRLKVLSTRATGSHPVFDNDTNDQFRAVHDAFGHAGTGRGFDRHGEEAAWLSHQRMFTPAARPAMTIETRGQNSALNYGSNPSTFAPQKVGLLPSNLTSPLTNPIGRRSAVKGRNAAALGGFQTARG